MYRNSEASNCFYRAVTIMKMLFQALNDRNVRSSSLLSYGTHNIILNAIVKEANQILENHSRISSTWQKYCMYQCDVMLNSVLWDESKQSILKFLKLCSKYLQTPSRNESLIKKYTSSVWTTLVLSSTSSFILNPVGLPVYTFSRCVLPALKWRGFVTLIFAKNYRHYLSINIMQLGLLCTM